MEEVERRAVIELERSRQGGGKDKDLGGNCDSEFVMKRKLAALNVKDNQKCATLFI